MTKLTDIVNSLTAEELGQLIDKAKLKIESLEEEEKVELIAVTTGILVEKWFSLEDEDKAIAFAHEIFNKKLADSKKRGFFGSDVGIDTSNVPKSDVNKYLED